MKCDHEIESGIFLCYASQDMAQVQEIYAALRRAGFRPWMDKPPRPFHRDGLSPGVLWDEEIRSRIRDSRYFVACFSTSSVSKEGYVQRECRLALDRMAEIPAGRRFVIPVLLDVCQVPRTRVDGIDFDMLQWFNLHEEGLDELVAVFKRLQETDGDLPTTRTRDIANSPSSPSKSQDEARRQDDSISNDEPFLNIEGDEVFEGMVCPRCGKARMWGNWPDTGFMSCPQCDDEFYYMAG